MMPSVGSPRIVPVRLMNQSGKCVTGLPSLFFFLNATATTEIYTLSLHDALPIYDFLFDLTDHPDVAEMHFANVDRSELIAPCLRLARDFGAHRLAHVVARLEHLRERHVAT